MSRKLTKEEILQKAIKVHGLKYNYDLVDFDLGILDYQKIVCPIHGIFEQQMNNHVNGNCGCRKCGSEKSSNSKKTTKEDYINKAIKVHGDFYNYENTIIDGMHNDIIVTCPIHGNFQILAWNHINPLNFQGCKKCRCLSKEEFIEECNKIHNNKYNYDKVEWKSTKHKIIIGCPIHGDFTKYAGHHIYAKSGCRNCAHEELRISQEDIIERFTNIHGNAYDYSKVKYNSTREKVEIVCRHHGSFWQVVNSHLAGNGCKKCNDSKGEKYIRLFLEKK